ncbi:MAG: DUF4388 domain-containing protein [Cyanobacteriota/Melainabacteria group bacterium]
MTLKMPLNVNTMARSIGCLVDRTMTDANYLGNVWLIDEDKVATCAHLVSRYSNYLDALIVRFPGSAPGTSRDFGVESALFHPSFDQAAANQLQQVSLTEPMPAVPLQKHNAVVLKLKKKIPELSDTISFRVNKNLSLPIPPREQGLGGNLREIELFVVIQSITNARKEGIITICDERNYPVARIFCKDGRLVYAQYRNLVNEMAIYQIVNRELDGNFFFWAADKPNWEVTTAIAKPAEMVLIEASRRFDELKTMVPHLGGPETLYEKTIAEPNVEILPGPVKDYCRRLWDLLDGGTPLGQLWQVSNLDDYSIYVTIAELKRTQQIGIKVRQTLEESADGEPAKPLQLAVNAPLAPYDQITSIHIDSHSGRALSREGSLLGAMRQEDKFHLLHNVRLVPEATGSPLFKEDRVIGMHCGPLPPNFQTPGSDSNLQGMLWVDCIVECLRAGGDAPLAARLTLTDMPLRRTAEPEAEAVAQAEAEADTAKSDAGSQAAPDAGMAAGATGVALSADPAPVAVSFASDGHSAGGKEPGDSTDASGSAQAARSSRIDCPKCGRTSQEGSRYCKSCGEELHEKTEAVRQKRRKSATPIFLVLAVLLLAGLGGLGYFVANLPKPKVVSGDTMVIPDKPWVKLHIYKKTRSDNTGDSATHCWKLQDEGTIYKEKDLIHLKLDVLKKAYVYLIYFGSDQPALIYPGLEVNNKVLDAGTSFTFPDKVSEYVEGNMQNLIGLEMQNSPGVETFVVLASPRKLQLSSNPAAVQDAYRRAVDDIEGSHSDTGVEDSLANFCKGLVGNDSLKDIDADGKAGAEKSIFIDRYLIKHVKQ